MRPRLRFAAYALLALSGVTCTDGPTSPNRGGGPALLNIAPSFSAADARTFRQLGDFGLGVNNIHIHIDHPPAAPFDTVVTVPPGADSVALNLPVILNSSTEQLNVQLELRHGDQVLYSGTQSVTATVGANPTTTTSTVPIVYVGPGASAVSFAIAPGDTAILVNGVVPYRISAQDAKGANVTGLAINWQVVNAALGAVDANSGIFTPSGAQGTTKIIASTPNGLSDTVSVTVSAIPTQLAVVSGDKQTGPAGSALSQPVVVRVGSSVGSGVVGATVTFAGTNGATVSPATAVTGADGTAQTTVTLGPVAGAQSVTATVGVLAPVSASVTAVAGTAAQISKVSGDAQMDTLQAKLSAPFVVRVQDKLGNVVAGATVSWTRTAGSGMLAAATSVSDNSGLASAQYTLGGTPGTDTVTATLASGASAVFTATASRAAATIIVISSGDRQIGLVGTTLAQPLVVKATDKKGTPIVGTRVAWGVRDGLGTVSPDTSVTDANGLASATYTLPGTAAFTNVTATLPNGAQVLFVEQAALPVVGALRFVVQPSNVLSATLIVPSIQVEVLDGSGNRDSTGANANAIVALSVLHGPTGGQVRDSLGLHGDTVQAVKGLATFKVGNDVAGTYKLLASSPSLKSDSSVSYVVSVGPPRHLEITVGESGSLTGSPYDTTNVRPTVRVSDKAGNAVVGATVTWAVDLGGGNLANPSTPTVISGSVTTATGANGTSAVHWHLGPSGFQSMHATVAGVSDTAYFSTTISAQGYALAFTDDLDEMTFESGAPITLHVQVVDEAGDPVAQAGVPVMLYLLDYCDEGDNRVPAGNRARVRAPRVVRTPPASKAPVGVRTRAPAASRGPALDCYGGNRAPAASRATSPRPVGRGGTAPWTSARRGSKPGPTLARGGPSFQVQSVNSGVTRPAPNVADPALVGDTVAITDATGKATFTNIAIAGLAFEDFDLYARDTTTDSPLYEASSSGSLYLHPGAPYSVAVVYDSVHQAVGRAVADAPIVVVLDSAGNEVSGVPVALTVAAGGGSLEQSEDILGEGVWIPLDMWTLGEGSGVNKLTVTAPVSGPQNSVTVVAIAHQPAALMQLAPPPVSVQDSVLIGTPQEVWVADSTRTWSLNVPGVLVTPSVILNPAGQDANTPVVIGATGTQETLSNGSASFSLGIHGTPGSSVSLVYSAEGLRPDTTALIGISAGPPASLAPTDATPLSAIDAVGTAERDIALHVKDTSNVPVGGVKVSFLLTSTGTSGCKLPNSGSSMDVYTNAGGVALLKLQLPPNAASCMVTATASNGVNPLSGSPVQITEVVAPAGVATWTGAADTSWNNPANWSTAAVPTQATAVFLPMITTTGLGGGTFPALVGATSVGAMQIENGTLFDLNGYLLKVYGNVTPTGSQYVFWNSHIGPPGTVEMMTPGSQLAMAVPGKLMIGDTGMSCAGATPIEIAGLDSATAVDINCPVALTASGTNWLTSIGDVNIQHHGTLAMSGSSNWLYVGGNLNVTSDQSSEGLLTGGNIQVFQNFSQDTVAGVPASYRNFYSTGTSLLMQNPHASGTQTIRATSSQVQFAALSAANVNGAAVQLSTTGTSTYTATGALSVSSGLGVESFTIPSGITLNANYLSMGSTGRLYVNGTFNSTQACDAAILPFIGLGVNGIITPLSCHPAP